MLRALLRRYLFKVEQVEQAQGERDKGPPSPSFFFPLSICLEDALFFNRKMALHEVWMLIFVQYRIPRCESSIPQYRKFFPSLPQYRTKFTPDTAIPQTPKYPSYRLIGFIYKYVFQPDLFQQKEKKT